MTDVVTPPALAEWLKSSNTPDVLHNLAVVNARLSGVLAEILNLQKDVVSEVAERLKKISELTNEIRAVKIDDVTKLNGSGLLGKTKEDSLRILNALKDLGIPDLDQKINEAKNSTGPISVLKAWIDSIIPSLQGVSESESNRSQQEGLRLQTFTSRYTQSGESASSAMQKRAQSANTIINNFRISG